MVGLILRARVGEKGQVVIPKPIRDQFKIGHDTAITFSVEDDKVVLSKEDAEKIYQEAIFNPERKKAPKHIDWDALYYSQFEQ